MAISATGAVSLSTVNTELGYNFNTTISLNDASVRSLLGVPSGQISLGSARGKAVTVTTNALVSGGPNVEGYYYALFSDSGTFTVSNGRKSIEYIVVGGGGGGGSAGGGGGAGGKIVQNTGFFSGTNTVLVGAGGSAINANPITDIPNNGSESSITTPSGSKITADGGGRGGTRYSSTATVYRNGESGGGGAAYANAVSSAGPNGTTGGNGKANYGGSGAGGDLSGAAGVGTVGGYARNYLFVVNWIYFTQFGNAASFYLSQGGAGSGYVNATTGLGGYNTSLVGGDAGRQVENTSLYFGTNGNHSITAANTGFVDFTAGNGGGGGAFGTANGTRGTTWRGGGNGARGCVLLRWK